MTAKTDIPPDANFELWRQAVGSPDAADPRITFFFHMGLAISRWADVDRDLFHIFKAMLGSNSKAIAAHQFFKTPGINDHMTMTDALVGIRYPKGGPQATKWKAIKKLFDDNIPFRNRLAHDPVTQTVSTLSGQRATVLTLPLPLWEFRVAEGKLLKPKPPNDTTTISVEKIIVHIREVEKLQAVISDFRARLPKRQPRSRPRDPARNSQSNRTTTRNHARPKSPPRP